MGIEVNGRGRIVTDAHWQTNVPGVYAIGDVIEGQMLAHKAEDEGVAVAEFISGQSAHINYDAIPASSIRGRKPPPSARPRKS